MKPAALTVLLLLSFASVAIAQPQPVTITTRAAFGPEFLATEQYGTIIIESENRTAQPMRGTVRVTVHGWRNRPVPHEVAIDLPPRAKRRSVVTLFLGAASALNTELEINGRVLARHTMSPAYSGQEGVVVLGNPPRLRNALVDLRVMRAPDPYSGEQEVMIPVGAVEIDGATGDPVLPRQAVGYNGISLFVASIGVLAACPTEEREALLDWVRAGGQLLLFPRTEGDLADALVTNVFGPVERYEAQTRLTGDAVDQMRVVPPTARGLFLRSGSLGFREELFGGSHRLGFGRVYLATFDGMAPGGAEAIETKSLVQSLLSVRRTYGGNLPLFRLGLQSDALDDSGSYTAYGYGPAGFSSLRPALDPNESYKPALGLVAILLVFYVFIVGPANFTFIGRKNKPILALVTTPALAALCLVMLLGVGFIGKGTRTRFRAVELLEANEGDAFATSRKYSGLFFAHPETLTLASPPRGASRMIASSGSDPGVWVDRGDRMELTEVRGRLWETYFYREDAIVDFGQGVVFHRNGAQIAAVENRTTVALRSAAIVDSGGNVYVLGTIEPGTRVTVPANATDTVTAFSATPGYYGSSPTPNGFERLIGLDGQGRPLPDGVPADLADRIKLLSGLIGRAGGSLAADGRPALIAITDPPPAHASGFDREFEMRLVRVLPDPALTPLAVAPEPPPPPNTAAANELLEQIDLNVLNSLGGSADASVEGP